MKNIILISFFVLVIAANVSAQGIHFEDKLSWQEIKEKAKAEHKNIFIDFYATWCGPCKLMDSQVYIQKEVAEVINRDFISIRVQTDKTPGDSPYIQSWYKDGERLTAQYNISALPTLIFITSTFPETVINSSIGYKSKAQLIKLAEDAMNPSAHYGKLKGDYASGKLELSLYPLLSLKANAAGENALGLKVLQEYKKRYYDRMSLDEVLKPVNLRFLLDHRKLLSSKDRIFKYAFRDLDNIDPSLKNLAENVIIDVIEREEISQKLWKGDTPITMKPKWDEIADALRDKYGPKYIGLLSIAQKLRFYDSTEQWMEYVALTNEDLIKSPIRSGDHVRSWQINDRAWSMFRRCSKKELLQDAIRWSSLTIDAMGSDYKRIHEFYDTKANLLHKIGRTEEAIGLEKRAIILLDKYQNGIADYRPALEKMEKGVPTW